MGVFFEAYGTVLFCPVYGGCGDGQSKLTSSSGEATFTYTSNAAGSDNIYAYADSDPVLGTDHPHPTDPYGAGNEDLGTAAATRARVAEPHPCPPRARPSPASSIVRRRPPGIRGGNPVAVGFAVEFSVTGATGHPATETTRFQAVRRSTATTGSTAGSDPMSAFADNDNDGIQDPGELGAGSVTKRWLAQTPDTVMLEPPTANYPLNTTQTRRRRR